MTRQKGRFFLIAALAVAVACAALIGFRFIKRSSAPPPPASVATPAANPAKPAGPISTIIDLPGDPVLVRRGPSAALRSVHIDAPIALTPNAAKFDGDAYFVASPLLSTNGGFMGKFPETGEGADQAAMIAVADQVDQSDAAMEAGFDDDGGANTPAYADALLPNAANVSQIEVKAGGANGQPQIKETVIKTVASEKLSDLLIRAGYSEESARAIEAASKALYNIQALPAGSVAIAEGALDVSGAYRVVQLALYEGGEYVGAVALAEAGGYGEGAKPPVPEGVFNEGQSAPAAPAQYNLADGLYSAGVRNNVPEPVIREAIQLLGKMTDLKALASPEATMRLMFSRVFRGKSKSTGRIIYVGLVGPGGAVDCYPFAGADGEFRCFNPKGGAPAAPIPTPRPGAPPVGAGEIFPPIKGAPITSLFGMRFHPILHIMRLHAGIDFGAPIGSIVRAVADGKVEIAGPVSGFGNHVRLKHNGFETSYSHLSEIPANITPGATVVAGQEIGLSGNTGLSTGPHLHFEYYLNGVAVDPLPHMTGEAGAAIASAVSAPSPPSEQEIAGFNTAKATIDAALDAASR